jgi:hypothetical protein
MAENPFSGEVVGMSARAVNNRLIDSGLQYRTDDRKIPYRPTELPLLQKCASQTTALDRKSL